MEQAFFGTSLYDNKIKIKAHTHTPFKNIVNFIDNQMCTNLLIPVLI